MELKSMSESWVIIGKAQHGKSSIFALLKGLNITQVIIKDFYPLFIHEKEQVFPSANEYLIDTKGLTDDINKNRKSIYKKILLPFKLILVIKESYFESENFNKLKRLLNIVVETFELNESRVNCLSIIITKGYPNAAARAISVFNGLSKANIIAKEFSQRNHRMSEFGFFLTGSSNLKDRRDNILNQINSRATIMIKNYFSINTSDSYSNLPNFQKNDENLKITGNGFIYLSGIFQKIEGKNVEIQAETIVVDCNLEVFFQEKFEVICETLEVQNNFVIIANCLKNSLVIMERIQKVVNGNNLLIKFKQYKNTHQFPSDVQNLYDFPTFRLESLNVSGNCTKFLSFNNKMLDFVVKFDEQFGLFRTNEGFGIKANHEIVLAKFCINECMRTEGNIKNVYPSMRGLGKEEYFKRIYGPLETQFCPNLNLNRFPYIFAILLNRKHFLKLTHSDFKCFQNNILKNFMKCINEYLKKRTDTYERIAFKQLIKGLAEILLDLQKIVFKYPFNAKVYEYKVKQEKNIQDLVNFFSKSQKFSQNPSQFDFFSIFIGYFTESNFLVNEKKEFISKFKTLFKNVLKGMGNLIKKLIRAKNIKNPSNADVLLKNLCSTISELIRENNWLSELLKNCGFVEDLEDKITKLGVRVLGFFSRGAFFIGKRSVGLVASLASIPIEISANAVIAKLKSGFYDHLLDLS